jgi:hypothetical protein
VPRSATDHCHTFCGCVREKEKVLADVFEGGQKRPTESDSSQIVAAQCNKQGEGIREPRMVG